MKLTRIILAVLACAVLAQGCKKEEEEVTYLYFNGKISISLPKFVQAGETYTFNRSEISSLYAKGVEESEIQYYVTDPYTSKNDTLDQNWAQFTFKVQEDLGTFNLVIKGFLPGFINSSATATFTTVDPRMPGGSVSNTEINEKDPGIIDGRDGKKYYYAEIGSLLWMRNSLAYEKLGIPYSNSEAMTNLFGRFYTYEEALTVCPEGWRLPSDADWDALFEEVGNNAGKLMALAEFNNERMWKHWQGVNPDNASKLAILPIGYANPGLDEYQFFGINEYAALWTSDKEGEMAVYRYIYQKNDVLYRNTQTTDSFRIPVRCVKNK